MKRHSYLSFGMTTMSICSMVNSCRHIEIDIRGETMQTQTILTQDNAMFCVKGRSTFSDIYKMAQLVRRWTAPFLS